MRTSSSYPVRALLALIAAVAVAFGGLAVSPVGAASAAPAEAAISGTVVFPTGFTYSIDSPPVVSANADGTTTFVTFAVSASGTFAISGLLAGTKYRIWYSDGNGGSLTGYYTAGGTLNNNSSAATLVTAPAEITLRPVMAASISGRVVFPSGYSYSASNQPVVVAMADGDLNTGMSSVASDGTFTITRLSPGTKYRIRYSDSSGGSLAGYYTASGTLTSAQPSATLVTTPAAGLVLRPGTAASISGTVQFPTGYTYSTTSRPSVFAYAEGSDALYTGDSYTVAADGTFTMFGLIPGTKYRISYSDFSNNTLSGSYTADGTLTRSSSDAALVTAPSTSITLRPALAAAISGTVEFPVGYTYSVNTQPAVYAYADGDRLGTAASVASNGTFTISGLAAGTNYRINYSDFSGSTLSGYYTTGGTLTKSSSAGTLVSAPTTGITLRPTKAVTISGTVAFPQGFSYPTNSGIYVYSYYLDPESGSWINDRVYPVGTDGSFSIAGLAPGTQYRVRYDDLSGGSLSGYYTAGGTVVDDPAAATLVVAPQSNLTLRPSAGEFASTPAPTISGTAKVGSTLSVTAPSWDPSASFTFTWLRNGVEVGSGSSYQLTAADANASITVRATGSAPGRATLARESAPVTIALGTLAASDPAIIGAASVGGTLEASVSGWTAGTSFTYEWLSNGSTIAGATGATYAVSSTDAGTTISVEVSGAQPGYEPASRTSAGSFVPPIEQAPVQTPTTAIASTPASTSTLIVKEPVTAVPGAATTKVAVTGIAKVGKTLSAKVAKAPKSTKVTYTWYRNGKAIKSATKAKYKLTSKDKGKKITVKTTLKRAGYKTVVKTSKTVKVK